MKAINFASFMYESNTQIQSLSNQGQYATFLMILYSSVNIFPDFLSQHMNLEVCFDFQVLGFLKSQW
jgi:hypothetical protein